MGKTAVITGCTKGIGAAITKRFLSNDCEVIGCFGNDENNAEKFSYSLGNLKNKFFLHKADLSTMEGIDEFIDYVKSVETSVDYIVLNAGMTDRTGFGEISYEIWNRVMHLNLYSPFFIVQGLNSIINEEGRIIIVGSVLGQVPHAMSMSYAISKAGVHQMAKNLVKEFADRNITVNVVAPGFVDTPWQKNKSPDHRKRIENKIALQRFGEPCEIAQLCWSIVENPYINGSIINIDGGYDYR